MNNKSSFITVSPQLQPSQDHITMAAPKSPASNKSANVDNKKKATSKSETKKTPIKKLKAATPRVPLRSKRTPALKAMKAPTIKSKSNPTIAVKKAPLIKKASTLKTHKAPAKKISLKTLKSPSVKSKAAKKASLKKVAEKVIKKKTAKKAEKMAIKKLDAKSAKGGVAAFDLEAFVKVKFSELEKTAHQKKVVLETVYFHKSILLHCRTSLVEQTALWQT